MIRFLKTEGALKREYWAWSYSSGDCRLFHHRETVAQLPRKAFDAINTVPVSGGAIGEIVRADVRRRR